MREIIYQIHGGGVFQYFDLVGTVPATNSPQLLPPPPASRPPASVRPLRSSFEGRGGSGSHRSCDSESNSDIDDGRAPPEFRVEHDLLLGNKWSTSILITWREVDAITTSLFYLGVWLPSFPSDRINAPLLGPQGEKCVV